MNKIYLCAGLILGLIIPVNAQVSLVKNLPPSGVTYLQYNASVSENIIVAEGSNITWDFNTISFTKVLNSIVKSNEEVPEAEKQHINDASFVVEVLMLNTDLNPRTYYKIDGNVLNEIGFKQFGTSNNPRHDPQPVFVFDTPYQGTMNVNIEGMDTMKYVGYGTLKIKDKIYNNVALLKGDGSEYLFYLITPFYHKLARVTNRSINYWELSEESLSAGEFELATSDGDIITTPNPANNELYLNNISVGSQIRIFDLNGKIQIETIANSTNNLIDISKLSSGIYIVQLNSKEGIINKKVVILK